MHYHQRNLLRNSLVSPTLLAGIWNPRAFLKDFKGVCVTDGYQTYHTIEKERENLRIAGCWNHARRRFDEAVKALPKDQQKSLLAYLALKQIQAIYREENKLASMTTEERLKHRQLTVKPLVDAYFTWVKQNLLSETAKANNLKPYNYFEYLLTEIPKHMDEHDACFCEALYILISTSDGLSPIRHRNSRKRRILPICKCAKK